MKGMTIFIIAAIIATLISMFTIQIYDYSFILITAFTGAFIASIDLQGILNKSDVEETLTRLILGNESLGVIFLTTIILGIIGIYIQLARLKNPGVVPMSSKDSLLKSEKLSALIEELLAVIQKYIYGLTEHFKQLLAIFKPMLTT